MVFPEDMDFPEPMRHGVARTITLIGIGVLIGASASAAEGPWFHDIAADVGVNFRHYDGRSGQKYYVETTASGGGWLDVDADGDLDLYLVNGAPTPGSTTPNAVPRNVLYENRDGRFHDITERAGVGDTGYGMGFCVGDVDGDGLLDFLLTNFGRDRLYRNRGDGRFTDIAANAGLGDASWSGSCAFGDLDGDGDLDLYVSRYVDFSFARNPYCGERGPEGRRYCQPESFRGLADSLYINQGNGSFSEEGAARGIARGTTEKGMGVLLTDLDLDGDLDLYVANDGALNRLYVNNGKGHFEDLGLISGAGLNAVGTPEAGMGIDAGDTDGDGRPDLIVTHFAMETNTLYKNLGPAFFEDTATVSGVGKPSYRQVGWGVRFFDADNDGDLDLAVANGHMQEGVEKDEPSLRYAQPNLLFENQGDGRFQAVPDAGPAWRRARVSRGLAVGDWNDDGRLDVLITNTNDLVDLLENRHADRNHWLGLRLEGPPGNRFAIGARVIVSAGKHRQHGEVRSGGSFQSQSDLRLHFGLGNYAATVNIEVHWPDGRQQRLETTTLDRYLTIAYRPEPSTP